MSSTTHKIEITPDEYVNVSNGNLNCALFLKYGQEVRIHIGGSAPDPATEEYHTAGGGLTAAGYNYRGFRVATRYGNLIDEDDIWVRAEGGIDHVIVVRGNVQMS